MCSPIDRWRSDMTQDSAGGGSGGGEGPVERSARAAAKRLAADYGPRLVPDVEAALYTAGTAQRPEQYLDPISLAALLVAAAQFGWQLYQDHKKETATPSREVVERRIRVELPQRSDVSADDRNRIIAVITEEIVTEAEEVSSGHTPRP